MLYIVAFEESCQNPTSAESIRLQCNQDQDGRRQRVSVPYEMLVEVGNQTSWEVHDAMLSNCGSGSHRATKLEFRDRYLQASL